MNAGKRVCLGSQVLLMRPVWGNSMFVSRCRLCACVLQRAQRAGVDRFVPANPANTLACSAAHGHGGAHLSHELGAGLQGAQGGSHAPRHPDHSQSVPQAGGFLVGEARQGTDAAQT